MKIDVTYKNLEESVILADTLDKNFEKIERRVTMYRDGESIRLVVHLEKSTHRQEYFCNAHMHLPAHMLKVQGKADSIEKAIHKGFLALSKQLDKLKVKVETHLQKGKKKISPEPEEE